MSSKTTKAAIDAATADAIERASHFTVSIRVRNSQHTEEVRSLDIARQAAELMPEALGSMRRALVYAVTPEGRAYLVPEDFPDPANPDQREAFMNLVSMAAALGGATHMASNGVTLAGKPTPAPEAGKAAADVMLDAMPPGLRRSASEPGQKTAKQAADEAKKGPVIKSPGASLKNPAKSQVAGTKAAELKSAAASAYTTKPAGKPASPPAKAAEPKAEAKQESPMASKASKNKARTAVKAKTTKPAKPGERTRYDWNAAEEAAAKGKMPKAPDFSAPTHERFRPLLAEVVKAAVDGSPEALRKIKINPVSSSPKAVKRFRDLCLKALTAKKAA